MKKNSKILIVVVILIGIIVFVGFSKNFKLEPFAVGDACTPYTFLVGSGFEGAASCNMTDGNLYRDYRNFSCVEGYVVSTLYPVFETNCTFGCSNSTNTCLGNTSCATNWYIGEWGICVNGFQNRTVTDMNGCGTDLDKPNISQSCNNTCIPNWVSSGWSTCNNSIQTRTVSDLNNCNTTIGMPAAVQSCTLTTSGGGGTTNTTNTTTTNSTTNTTTNTTSNTASNLLGSGLTTPTPENFFFKYKWVILTILIAGGIVIYLYFKK
jgi:hypothetical protein